MAVAGIEAMSVLGGDPRTGQDALGLDRVLGGILNNDAIIFRVLQSHG